MRTAVVTRRPACKTDVVFIYTQSGRLMATRHGATDTDLDAILARYSVDATRVTVSS